MQVYKKRKVLGERILRLKNAFEKLTKEPKFINLKSTDKRNWGTVPKSTLAFSDNPQSRDSNHSLSLTVSSINIIKLKFQDTILN